MTTKKQKEDVQDWKDDFLHFLAIGIIVVMSLLFHDFLASNPSISAVLQPERVGLLVISFGAFMSIYLLIQYLNREKI